MKSKPRSRARKASNLSEQLKIDSETIKYVVPLHLLSNLYPSTRMPGGHRQLRADLKF